MSSPKHPVYEFLLAQSDPVNQRALHAALERDGFQVARKSTIKNALGCLAAEAFEALICGLHLPEAGDGFTLVNAMRHFHPNAITIVMSNYPALRESVSALLSYRMARTISRSCLVRN